MPTTRRLHASSRHHKSLCSSTSVFTPSVHITPLITFSEMDIGKQRALVRKAAAACKQQEQASRSAPNVGLKAILKRKPNTKDDHLSKKRMGPLIGEQQQKASSPPSPHHGVGKGLMTGKGPVGPNPVPKLVTHKDYAVEMVTSIIKETNLDSCGGHISEDLGAFGLYDLSRVCSRHFAL